MRTKLQAASRPQPAASERSRSSRNWSSTDNQMPVLEELHQHDPGEESANVRPDRDAPTEICAVGQLRQRRHQLPEEPPDQYKPRANRHHEKDEQHPHSHPRIKHEISPEYPRDGP